MYSSLKFIFTVFLFCCRHSSGYVLDRSRGAPLQVDFMIMIGIGGSILIVVLVLMSVVIYLCLKIDWALKALQVPVCLASKNNPPTVIQDEVTAAVPITAGSCHQYCDELKSYADFNPLPPCFCDAYEGL